MSLRGTSNIEWSIKIFVWVIWICFLWILWWWLRVLNLYPYFIMFFSLNSPWMIRLLRTKSLKLLNKQHFTYFNIKCGGTKHCIQDEKMREHSKSRAKSKGRSQRRKEGEVKVNLVKVLHIFKSRSANVMYCKLEFGQMYKYLWVLLLLVGGIRELLSSSVLQERESHL